MSMTKETLRAHVELEPFKPLTIHLVGGKQVRVPHPDHLFFIPNSDQVFIVSEVNGQQKFRFLTPDQIASVEA